VSHLSTVKPLKGLKNYSERGRAFERSICHFIHSDLNTKPLLISPKLLRSKNLGQVDCCWLNKNKIYIGECKSGRGVISRKQYIRLVETSLFISHIFVKNIKLVRITEVAKVDRGHYPFKVDIIKEFAP
jgi:hypothetical protein